jgi:transposase-like protein
MGVRDACPACGSKRDKNHGPTRHGTQHHPCTAGERQCVATAADRRLAHAQRTRVAPLLRERLSRRGIGRAVGVSLTWLLHFWWNAFTIPLMSREQATCPTDYSDAYTGVMPAGGTKP